MNPTMKTIPANTMAPWHPAPPRITATLTLWAAATSLALTARAGLLPNGNPTGASSAWDPTTTWSVTLKPNPAVFIPQGSCPWLIPGLTNSAQPYNNANNIWNYTYAALQGDFSLATYKAQAGGGNFEVDFQLAYQPKGTDPTGNSVRWLQVIDANYPSGRGTALGSTIGSTTAYMDNARDPNNPAGSDPFYGWLSVTNGPGANPLNGTLSGSAFANKDGFFDGPGGAFGPAGGFFGLGEDWEAQTFLATETDTVADGVTTHNVKIYDGVWWGFTIVPEPSGVSLLAAGVVFLLLAHRRQAPARASHR
jgi:hypothetical protein